MIFIRILIGIGLLFLGRKLFWLFVGALGFIFGAMLATQYLQAQPSGIVLIIALVVGIIASILAIFLQRVAVGIAGFLAGAYLTSHLLPFLHLQIDSYFWLAFIIGGIIGLILLLVLFDWALIILSSLVGANMIVVSTTTGIAISTFLFVLLLVIGIAFQASVFSKESGRSSPSK